MPIEHPDLTAADAVRADDIHEWLMSNRALQGLAEDLFDAQPRRWFRQLHSELTLLTDGEEIEAVFVNVHREPVAVDVTLFSTHRVLRSHVDIREDGEESWTTATSRQAVEEVSINERFGIIGREARREWPGQFGLTVRLTGHTEPLQLGPNTQSAFAARQPDMHALLKSLLADLN